MLSVHYERPHTTNSRSRTMNPTAHSFSYKLAIRNYLSCDPECCAAVFCCGFLGFRRRWREKWGVFTCPRSMTNNGFVPTWLSFDDGVLHKVSRFAVILLFMQNSHVNLHSWKNSTLGKMDSGDDVNERFHGSVLECYASWIDIVFVRCK